MSPETNLSIPPNKFSIDGVSTTVDERVFNGNDYPLPEIEFVHPETGACTFERSAEVNNFCFNGTALLTPAAFDGECSELNTDTIDRSRLSGELLVLDLESGVEYGMAEIRALLSTQDIELDEPRSVPEYIILFRTQLMKQVMGITDESGVPDYDKLAKTQQGRPGITQEGAEYLRDLRIAKAYMVDNISFEPVGQSGYKATQLLAGSNPETGEFTPLVYHVGRTETSDFVDKHQGQKARIELGNPPQAGLTGYPVGVFVE